MNAFEPSIQTFLITDAVLVGLALVQALIGVLFFRPFAAVTLFILQCLFLFSGVVITLGFLDLHYRFWGWACLVAFAPLFILGFRFWRKPAVPLTDASPSNEAGS